MRREGGGNGEVRRGRRGMQVKTDNTQGTQAVNLQGLAHLCPLPQWCQPETLWPGLAKDCAKLCCGQAFSVTRDSGVQSCSLGILHHWSLITYETDITFLKVLRIRGSQGEGRIHRQGDTAFWNAHRIVQDSPGQAASLCLLSTQSVLLCVSSPLLSQESDTK